MGAQLSKLVSTAGVASWWVFAATHAHAGGFAIAPQSASALGNVVASAAAAEDASTVWMNPAGMPLLPGAVNFTAVATAAFGSHRFRDGGSTGLFANPGSGDGGDAGTNEVIPSFYVTTRLRVASGHITAGLGVNVPFGLTTEYDPGWRGSALAIKSSAESVNINPAVAAQLSDGLFVGVGLNLQRFSTELTNVTAAGDLRVKVRDSGVGYNFGVLYRTPSDARLGLSYRSAISYTLTGDATFGAAPVLNGNVTADLKLPDSLSVHGFAPAGKNWEFMFDVTLTRWSHLDTVTVLQTTGLNAGGALAALVYRWRNTRTAGIGANYKLTEDGRTKVRLGIGYDQTPTADATRSPDLPEQDSLAFTLGLHHKNPAGLPGAIDVGFMYQRIKDAAINASTSPPIPGSELIGAVQNKGPIFAIQYSGSFK